MSFTRYPGIDYDWRPASYWEPVNPLQVILSNIKGANRRELIMDYARAGRLDEVEDELLQDELTHEQRERLGRIHPSFFGGEFLQRRRRGEITLVRITLASVMRDVVELRAAPAGDRARYRVVDEYETHFPVHPGSSRRPLALGQLIELIDHAGPEEDPGASLALCFLSLNFLGTADSLDDLEDFVSIHSDVYPDLGDHYDRVLKDWFEAQRRQLAQKEEP